MKRFVWFITVLLLWVVSLSAEEHQPNVRVFNTAEDMGVTCARAVADYLRTHAGKKVVLGLATGSTPLPVYYELKKILLEEKIDLSQLITFNLDEYVGLPQEHPQSYHTFMFEHLFNDLLYSKSNPSGIKRENIHIPNAYAKDEKALSKKELKALTKAFPTRAKNTLLTEQEEAWILKHRAEEYEALITQHGPIDIQLLGIGTNGHIGFAEPGASFTEKTNIVYLTENTRYDNARFFQDDISQVPHCAFTMGISTILQAKKIYLLATGEHKAPIVHLVLHDPVSSQIPATALRLHPNMELFLDMSAAALKGTITRYYNGRLLKDHCIEPAELWVAGGKVIAPQKKADVEVDVQGLIIAPGYIDIQINGGFGIDFSQAPEKVSAVAKQLPRYGITSFLPTVISSSSEQYRSILPCLQAQILSERNGSHILGIHLEGPFFNPDQSRAHNPAFLQQCVQINSAEDIYGCLDGVKMITLAPELEGSQQIISLLCKKGIVVAAGHSSASYAHMQEAIARGVCCVTHLFNAMPSFHHRDPGIIGTVLAGRELFYSIIGDPHHLHPKAIELAWRAHPDGLILVSDAMAALGLPSGTYTLGTMDVEVSEGKAVIQGTQTIAGSVVSLDSAVRYLHDSTGCDSAYALEAASLKPAQLLGLQHKGTLNKGADADFILLDDSLFVKACYIAGELAWK